MKLDLSIRTKLLGSFAVVLALMAGLGVYAISSLANVKSSALFIVDNSVPGVKIADDATVSAVKYRKDQLHYIASVDAKDRAQIAQDLAGDISDVNAAVKAYVPTLVDAKDKADLTEFDQAFKTYVAQSKTLQGLVDRGQIDAAIRLIGTGSRADHSWDQVKKGYGDLRDYNFVLAAHARGNAVSVAQTARTWVIGLLVAALLIAGALGFVLARWIGKRLATLRRGAETIAAGDLSIEVETGARDEIGAVTDAFARMLAYLRTIPGGAQRIAAGRPHRAGRADRGRRRARRGSFAGMSELSFTSQHQPGRRRPTPTSPGTPREWPSTSEEAGRAVGEIALGRPSGVASGAERQVRMTDQTPARRPDGRPRPCQRGPTPWQATAWSPPARRARRCSRVREASQAVSDAIGSLSLRSPSRSAGSSRRSPRSPARPTCWR